MPSDQSILERLLCLEKKDEVKTKEMEQLRQSIHALQKENVSFKTELLKCQKENVKLREKTDILQKRLTAIKKNTRRLQNSNQGFRKTTSSLTSKVNNVESTVNQISGLQKVLNRSLVNRQNEIDVYKKVEDLSQRTKIMETKQGNVSESVTRVELNTRENLSTGNWIKLDRCVNVTSDKGVFDQRCSCLVPRCDGDYGVGVMCRQEGEGLVDVGLYWEGSDGYGRRVGQTGSHWDICCGMDCLSLKKGQKVWVKALRLKGDQAEIRWCRVWFWLLG